MTSCIRLRITSIICPGLAVHTEVVWIIFAPSWTNSGTSWVACLKCSSHMGTGYLHSCEFGIPSSLPKDTSYHLTSGGKSRRTGHEVNFWKHLRAVLGFASRKEIATGKNKEPSIFHNKWELTHPRNVAFPFTGCSMEEYLFSSWRYRKISENSFSDERICEIYPFTISIEQY